MTRQVLAIVTDTLEGPDAVRELSAGANGDGVAVRLITPAVEANAFRHTMGDIDEPKREAEQRLQVSLATLRQENIAVEGEVGDPDPVQAAADALRERPADEVVIFEHAEGQARWYEDGLFDKAKEELEPPLRLVVIEAGGGGEDPHVVDVEQASAGTEDVDPEKEIGSAYLPNLSRRDFAGMVVGIVGTVAAAILAAAAAGGSGEESGWPAAAILIAIGLALINLAHVVGLTLFETVHYRGGFAKFFRTVALVATPLGVLINLGVVLFA